ncbi:hypothetical protein QFC19_009256 [Naganishia cerealis]|uniref:Uncharacterized protein n=1 Tax=Naganishia cerealis TaxID=610337 RepID=A0ACC2UXJ1_9TREE|nr:hypothetical protein QFC19_009256 [Naganishia cerealis]
MPPRRAAANAARPQASSPELEPIAGPAVASFGPAVPNTTGDAEFAAALHQQEVAAREQQRQALARRQAIEEVIRQRRAERLAAGDAEDGDDGAAGLGVGRGGAARYGVRPVPRAHREWPGRPREPYMMELIRAQLRNEVEEARQGRGNLRFENDEDIAARQAILEQVNLIWGPYRQQSVEESWSGINFTPRHNPLLGFTYDFDKDAEEEREPAEIVRLDFDDDSPIIEELKAPTAGTSKHSGRKNSMISVDGNGKVEMSLVCARCNEQLRVSQGQRSDADRVFALRCGHLIDKRCLDEISQPRPEQEISRDEETKPGFVKMGKGKAVESSQRAGTFVVKGSDDGFSMTPKASASALPRIISPSAHLDQLSSSPPAPFNNREAGSSNQKMPARTTRSSVRAAATQSASDAQLDEVAPSEDEMDNDGLNRNAQPAGRKRNLRSKATNKHTPSGPIKKLKAPKETREFRWTCPVAACGREHFSEEIDGVWKPKNTMIVQLFV